MFSYTLIYIVLVNRKCSENITQSLYDTKCSFISKNFSIVHNIIITYFYRQHDCTTNSRKCMDKVCNWNHDQLFSWNMWWKCCDLLLNNVNCMLMLPLSIVSLGHCTLSVMSAWYVCKAYCMCTALRIWW